MPSLVTHLNSLSFSTQLDVIKNLIDNAQAKTTFWGSRVVEVNGFTGSVYLDDIAKKILSAGHQRSHADDLTPAERIAGVEVVRKLKNFYQVTDVQIQNSNFFTKFLNWIREFSFIPNGIRFYIEEEMHAEGYFRAYSEAKFLEQFRGSVDDILNHPAYYGCNGRLIVAREDRIRQLLFHV